MEKNMENEVEATHVFFCIVIVLSSGEGSIHTVLAFHPIAAADWDTPS